MHRVKDSPRFFLIAMATLLVAMAATVFLAVRTARVYVVLTEEQMGDGFTITHESKEIVSGAQESYNRVFSADDGSSVHSSVYAKFKTKEEAESWYGALIPELCSEYGAEDANIVIGSNYNCHVPEDNGKWQERRFAMVYGRSVIYYRAAYVNNQAMASDLPLLSGRYSSISEYMRIAGGLR